MKKILFVCLGYAILAVIVISCSSEKNLQVKSPDGRIELFINPGNDDNPTIHFSVFYNKIPVLQDCPFSLSFKDMPGLGRNLEPIRSETRLIDENWERVWGKRKKVRNYCNELTLELREKGERNRQLNIIFRAYNDGIAFRYNIPEQETISDFRLARENTLFNFSGDHKIWAAHWNNFLTSQEEEFREEQLSDLKMDDILGTPLLIQVDTAIWAAILEADLTDWAGMCLAAGPKQNSVITRLAPLPSEPEIVVRSSAPRNSPWRVVMLADHPGRFIESDIIQNLNEPCALQDVSWIHPGKSAWDWWWSNGYAPDMKRKLGPDMESHKYFIDFASEMGWTYQLVDWFWYGPPFASFVTWEPNPESDITRYTEECNIPEIVKYAGSKGVKTIIWLQWNHVNDQMDKAFPLYEKWGVAGIKVDFMNRNDQEMVNFYHRVVKKAAEYHLVVDFHGAYMPTGFERTYPNFITREGVLGNEYSKWSNRITPDHCLTIPFTRMLGGHMDFTPGGFIHGTRETFQAGEQTGLPYTMVMGTRCYQLAMLVVYESALQVICDSPFNYRKDPAGLDFLKIVPTTWDETMVLDGKVGDYIIVARKSGSDWYVGGMTDWSPRTLNVSFGFLGPGEFKAEIWKDSPDSDKIPANLNKEELFNFNSQYNKELSLAPAGGFVMHISPE
jgi:alpha-glucosidase